MSRCMAISEEGLPPPEILQPCPSVTTRSSGCMRPLQTPEGVVRMRPSVMRTERLPSVEAAKTRSLFRIEAMLTCNATAAGDVGAEAVPDYTANRQRKHKPDYRFVDAAIASPCDVKVPGLLTGAPRQARSASLTSLKIVCLF